MRSLVIGHGSIGSLHAKILSEMDIEVCLVSNQKNLPYKTFTNIEQAIKLFDPNYIVIANKTKDHYSALSSVIQSKFKGKILVEKPLFEKSKKLIRDNLEEVFVGYNLRFLPALVELRHLLNNKNVISANIYVGQYLPNWRNFDYRESYSAKSNDGGGVLRDLSHEIDYVLWLFGDWEKVTAHGGKYSNLEIDSEDIFTIMIKSKLCPVITIQMSYLDRVKKRNIIINTNEDTYEVDLIKGNISINGNIKTFLSEKNITYKEMHNAIIKSKHHNLCTFEDGLRTIKLIEKIEKANASRWIKNG